MSGYNFASEMLTASVLSQYKEGTIIKKNVRVINMVYRKKETGFCIYEVEDETYRKFSIIGTFPVELTPNSYYEIEGAVSKKEDRWSLVVSTYKSYLPQTEEGIIQTLQSLQGLDSQAHKIYSILGTNALSIIQTSPELVVQKVSGVNMKRAVLWQRQLLQKTEDDKTIEALQAYGINLTTAKLLIDRYGPEIGSTISQNPYFLMIESGLISFSVCDKIAMQNNFTLDNMDRIMAAMLQSLRSAASLKGHCYLPVDQFKAEVQHLTGLFLGYREAQVLIKKATAGSYCWTQYGMNHEVAIASLQAAMGEWQKGTKKTPFRYYVYTIPDSLFDLSIRTLRTNGKIIQETIDQEPWYSLFKFYDAEKAVASSIRNIQEAAMPIKQKNQPYIDAYCKKNGLHLENKQMLAAQFFTKEKGGFFVLNGAAGCGKTFTLKVILGVLRSLYYANGEKFQAKILAPTGKAAKVANRATNLPAGTIHKELGIIGEDIAQTSNLNYINVNCLIVDEFSMVDIRLAQKLFTHISPTTKVILLGDTHQLPSILPGMVLSDIVKSNGVKVVTLDVVKRQSQHSGILINATKIIEGSPISSEIIHKDSLTDNAYLVESQSPIACRSQMLDTIQKLVCKNKINPIDIQVLCPQKKTEIGTEVMNLFLQKLLNPLVETENRVQSKIVTYSDESDVSHTETLYFQPRDKVIHVKNDYDMEWYSLQDGKLIKTLDKKGIINGETGTIEKIIIGKSNTGQPIKKVIVNYENQYVIYQNDFSSLQHAYALTIHKSQGSQWPIVIAPIMSCNAIMLNRQLLYTLYTRAEDTSFLFCQPDAVMKAINNNTSAQRYTFLSRRLTPISYHP